MSKDVHIGTIDNKKIYLMWHDVKDICNDEVKKENKKLKELLKECRDEIKFMYDTYGKSFPKPFDNSLLTKIDEALK